MGMGNHLYEGYGSVRELFDDASEFLGMDMVALCSRGPDEVLARTDKVQPAVTLVSLACTMVLKQEGVLPVAVAGHSLGEYAALYAAGVIDWKDVLGLVLRRGQLMSEAASIHPGGMIAVMGLGAKHVEALAGEAKSLGRVDVANYNSEKQVILTGEHAALEEAAEIARKAGRTLAVPLNVSGPWHSPLMLSASKSMQEELSQYSFASPSIPVISNVTGRYYGNGEEIRTLLSEQIVKPVQWLSKRVRGTCLRD